MSQWESRLLAATRQPWKRTLLASDRSYINCVSQLAGLLEAPDAPPLRPHLSLPSCTSYYKCYMEFQLPPMVVTTPNFKAGS